MNDFGNRLRKLRKSRGLTQAQLADLLGLSPAAIGNYENGDRIPRPKHLSQICILFNVTSDYLLGISSIERND